jgi:hypothetical protein
MFAKRSLNAAPKTSVRDHDRKNEELPGSAGEARRI